jgi:hypothetical protein
VFFRVEIATRMERNGAIACVRNAIVECGGWVTGHQLFSNMAASISFEAPMGAAETFVAALRTADLHPTFKDAIPSGTEGDLRVGVSLTFIHDEPDLKREVPAFG